jgi:hypothetical protein
LPNSRGHESVKVFTTCYLWKDTKEILEAKSLRLHGSRVKQIANKQIANKACNKFEFSERSDRIEFLLNSTFVSIECKAYTCMIRLR